jgi:hypothetical protein
LAPKPARK